MYTFDYNRIGQRSRLLALLVPLITFLVSEAIADDTQSKHLDRLKLNLFDNNWHDEQRMQDARTIVEDIKQRAAESKGADVPYTSPENDVGKIIPENFKPWWQQKTVSQLNPASSPVNETPHSLALRAIAHSAQIRVFSDVPVIRETAELEALGRYDVHFYAEGRNTDIDEPVGNELQTGGPERFLEDEWLASVGIRKKFITGTEIDLSQQFGEINNNSEFFQPKDQANTRISLTLTQPLLNGRGVSYNRSTLDIARIDASVALDEFKRQVESHLLELTRAYWGLWLERSNLVLRRDLASRTEAIAKRLEERGEFDANSIQITRVQSEAIRRRAETVRAETAVRNAEARILGLINDPDLRLSERFELIPELAPTSYSPPVNADAAIALALRNRPEIQQSFKQVRAARIRADMTRNELLPVLNFVAQYYRDGLRGDNDLSGAFDTQWNDGDGSWVLGLIFDMPIGNRAAKARNLRREIEVRQLSQQLRATLETILLELQVSIREVNTAWRDMQTKFASMQASNKELRSLEDRQRLDALDGDSGALALERILDAQDRLMLAEFDFLQSQITYNVAQTNLDRATGSLLEANDIKPVKRHDVDSNLPKWLLMGADGSK